MGKEKSYWISSGKFSLLERVSMLVFGVITFYLLVRVLDKSDYGAWMLFLSMTALLDTARGGFLRNPLMRFINKVDPEQKAKLQGSSFVMNTLFSIVSGLVLVLISYKLAEVWEVPQMVDMLYIYFVTGVFMSLFHHCEYVQRAHFRFKGPFYAFFIRSGVFCVVVVYYYIIGQKMDLILLSVVHGVSCLMATIVMWWFTRDIMSYKFVFDVRWFKELFSYGKYTLGTNVSAVFMKNVDMWMLGWLIGPAVVAVYNVAIRVANLFDVPLMAFAAVLFPQATKEAEERGDAAVKELYEKSVTLIIMVMFPFVIFVLVFSETIVTLIAGEEYIDAAMVLNVTMLYGLIVPFNKQMGIIFDAVGRARANMVFTMRWAILNGILNAIMIPTMGLMGAAYASLLTMVVAWIHNQIYLNKHYGVTLGSLLVYSKYYANQFYKRASEFF